MMRKGPNAININYWIAEPLGVLPTISTLWQFSGAEQRKTGPVYRFRCQGAVPARKGKYYLAKNYGGTITQIRRRNKAIEEMRTHEDLLRLLSNPQNVSRKNAERLPAARIPLKLDNSKQEVLQSIWNTQPSFMVQGPPGTGKTTLIQAFVDRLFASDPTAQVIITAHSHHTVDDVRIKLAKMSNQLGDTKRPIIVRLGARKSTEHDVPSVTLAMLERLSTSQVSSRVSRFFEGADKT